MAMSQFSLLWNAHKKSICSGLSALQQNGEFVDMTLAADGHLVKVHQIVIALASPYLKELISSAQCPHPVIFLSKISYATLSALLEYVYTGEVLVSMENLNDLILAGRELHISGLQDMKPNPVMTPQQVAHNDNTTDGNMDSVDDEICYFEVDNIKGEETRTTQLSEAGFENIRILNSTTLNTNDEESMEDEAKETQLVETEAAFKSSGPCPMQYTVSNQGSLQMILNRYVYYLKHANRNNVRQWRCVDYLNSNKCPAHVFTENDTVIQRISAHVHPFHDKRIIKKVRAKAVFSAISEAQANVNNVKSLLKKD